MTTWISNEFRQYRKGGLAEMRPYVVGENLAGIFVAHEDIKATGSPGPGGMIARNPENHNDQWYVAKEYFENNFEPVWS